MTSTLDARLKLVAHSPEKSKWKYYQGDLEVVVVNNEGAYRQEIEVEVL